VLLADLQVELATGPDELARVFSTAVVVFAVAVLGAGRAVDHYGPRRCVALAGVLSGAGLAVTALAPGLLVLHLGFGLLFGAGSGLAYSSVVTWASTRTGAHAGWSIGVVVAAYAAGPILAAPVGAQTSAHWGWRVTVGCGAIGVAAVLVLASRLLPGAVTVRGRNGTPGPPAGSDRPALVWLWVLFLAATAPGLFAFAYAADVVHERGLSTSTGGLVVALMATGNLVGRLLAGLLAARLGLRRALRADLVLLVTALAGLAWLPGSVVVLLGLPLLGVQYGAVSSLLPAAVREVCDPVRFGTAYGNVFTSWGLAGALAPTLHGPTDDYAAGFRSWLLAAVAAAIALVAYERRLRGQGGFRSAAQDP
jgi:OFA family oxalate/formate antiporter-like MFS transporter